MQSSAKPAKPRKPARKVKQGGGCNSGVHIGNDAGIRKSDRRFLTFREFMLLLEANRRMCC